MPHAHGMDDLDLNYYNTSEFRVALNDYYRCTATNEDGKYPVRAIKIFQELVKNFFFAPRKKSRFTMRKVIPGPEAIQLLAMKPVGDGAPLELLIDFDKVHFGLPSSSDDRRHQVIYVTPNTAVPGIDPNDYGGFSNNYPIPDALKDVLLALDLLSPPSLFKGKVIRSNYYQHLISRLPSTAQAGYHVDSHAQLHQPRKFLKQLPMLQISVMIGIQADLDYPAALLDFQDSARPERLQLGDICFFRADCFHRGCQYAGENHRALIQSCTLFYPMSQSDIGVNEISEKNYRKRKKKGGKG